MTTLTGSGDSLTSQPSVNDKSMAEQFEAIRQLSLELQSLIRQGVKEGVSQRIETRDLMLRAWFEQVGGFIQLTQHQEATLVEIMESEKQLLAKLEQEQRKLAKNQSGIKRSQEYARVGKDH
jgi:hypothetical protein